ETRNGALWVSGLSSSTRGWSPLKYQSNSGPTPSCSSAMYPSSEATACRYVVPMPFPPVGSDVDVQQHHVPSPIHDACAHAGKRFPALLRLLRTGTSGPV